MSDHCYDAMDRVLTMKFPDGETVSYVYDSQLLLDSITSSTAGSIASQIGHNEGNLPKQLKLSNGNPDPVLYLRYRYYGIDYSAAHYGVLWDMLLKAGTGPSTLFRLEHGYDNALNLTQTVRNRDTAGWEDLSFDYDGLDRLTARRETYDSVRDSFGYSQIGNIITRGSSSYTYGSSKPHAVTNDGVNPYGYDANGNMTQRGTGQYIKYDAENRPVKVSSDLGGEFYIARFAIDGDGRRAKRVDNFGAIHYVGPHYERNVGTGADTTEVITKFCHAQMGRVSGLIALKGRHAALRGAGSPGKHLAGSGHLR